MQEEDLEEGTEVKEEGYREYQTKGGKEGEWAWEAEKTRVTATSKQKDANMAMWVKLGTVRKIRDQISYSKWE